jgi:hypothetical protein
MQTSGLALPERVADLENRATAGGQQPLHRVFRRGLQVPHTIVTGDRDRGDIDIGAGGRHQQRGVDLEAAASIEKAPYLAVNAGSLAYDIELRGRLPIHAGNAAVITF